MTDHADTMRRDEFSNATPRPWYFDGWDIFSAATRGGVNNDGHRLVIPLSHLNETWHPSQKVSEDDARLIVQAVNERDALLAERQQAQQNEDGLRMQLEAEKHAHRKDNEYLFEQRQQAIERLRDRAVCSGCGQDVDEGGACDSKGCDDGEMIPSSELPLALHSMMEERNEVREELREAVAERQQLQEERDAAFDAVGLPRTASLDDLIRHHRNNAGMSASGHKIAAEEWEKLAVKAEAERQQAQDKLWEQSEAAANLVKEVERLEAERQQAQEERDQIARDYEWAWQQRRQAIDALRECRAVTPFDGVPIARVREIVDAALVKFGEKP